MSNYLRWVLIKLVPYPIISLMGGLAFIILEKSIMGDDHIYPSTGNLYSFSTSLVFVPILTITLGLVLGLIEELFFKMRFLTWPFFKKIVAKTALYVSVLIILILIFSWSTNAYNLQKSTFDPEVFQTLTVFLFSFTFVGILLYSGVVIAACLFFGEIVDYLGIEVASNFFTGKYNSSIGEDRVFMFLDMKGSTRIAEQLGNQSYYELVNDYYADMTRPIIDTRGQIYQYVGDEIVISWRLKHGLQQANCIQCFFGIKDHIDRNSEKYLQQYGLVPQFKAGIHCGNIRRGQVGFIKKEMLFTGDVLNTTARIQGLCNELNSNILISSVLKEKLEGNDFSFIAKGSFKLRGRNKEEKLFEVSLVSNN